MTYPSFFFIEVPILVNSVAAGLKTVSLRIVGFRPKRIGRYGWTLCSSADNYIGERLEAGNTEVRPIFYIGNRNDCRICVVTHMLKLSILYHKDVIYSLNS